ncbi:MAG: hypothetical protein P4L10_04255 [Acidobacteriaceae bacterium]|nr:hypothetical protein [Acidobacteriaceae bacterium]
MLNEVVQPLHHGPHNFDKMLTLEEAFLEAGLINATQLGVKWVNAEVVTSLPGTGNLHAQMANVERCPARVLLPRVLNDKVIRRHVST